jgi:hypothetical protein
MQMPGKRRASCLRMSETLHSLQPGCSPASRAQPLRSAGLGRSSSVPTLRVTWQLPPVSQPGPSLLHSCLLLPSLLQQQPTPTLLLTRPQRPVMRSGAPCRTHPCTGLTASLPGASPMVLSCLGASGCACRQGFRQEKGRAAPEPHCRHPHLPTQSPDACQDTHAVPGGCPPEGLHHPRHQRLCKVAEARVKASGVQVPGHPQVSNPEPSPQAVLQSWGLPDSRGVGQNEQGADWGSGMPRLISCQEGAKSFSQPSCCWGHRWAGDKGVGQGKQVAAPAYRCAHRAADLIQHRCKR